MKQIAMEQQNITLPECDWYRLRQQRMIPSKISTQKLGRIQLFRISPTAHREAETAKAHRG